MDRFWEEFETGEIHFRDKWQFELVSEFLPLPNRASNDYLQEFYIFIPNSLQINSDTYAKTRFYHAQTNLIRFKTPELSFRDVLTSSNENSPLTKLKQLRPIIDKNDNTSLAEWELKLFANIFQSTLAKEVYAIIQQLEKASTAEEMANSKHTIDKLMEDLIDIQQQFAEIKNRYFELPNRQKIHYIYEYVEDTISISLNSSLTALLKAIRNKKSLELRNLDFQVSKLLLKEKHYRENRLKEPSQLSKDSMHNEAILYQSSLLNKFILDALQLQTQRLASDEKFRSLIGSFAAGVAMLLYISLFVWQGSMLVFNSIYFIIFTVIIYILKDRIKEELKNISFKHVFKWFPDFTTKIMLPTEKTVIGTMQESFTFIQEKQVPSDIDHIRNEGFHTHLDMIKRPEQVMFYKKKISIISDPKSSPERLHALNVIFRYDLHEFMAKASNSTESYMTLDNETLDLITTQLPKVYHINIILKNSYLKPDLTPHIELKKYRIIVDKDGIKRIESVSEILTKNNANGEAISQIQKTP